MAASDTENLIQKKCAPCEGGLPALSRARAEALLRALKSWKLSPDARLISVDYEMKNFKTAVELVDRIAALAESENHHPDLHLTGYRKLRVELSTHAIGGLSENDFIVAAKIDRLPKEIRAK